MTLVRPTNEHERAALKSVTRRALQMAGGPDSFAHATRVKAPALSKYGAMHEDTSFLPIDVALDLDRDIGSPVVTEALAGAQGYKLVPAGAVCRSPLGYQDVKTLHGEFHDLTLALMTALEDTDVSPAELRDIEREGEDLIKAIRLTMARARSAVKGAA